MHRRDVVATLLFAGSSGCLRLQDGESDSATDGGTTTPAPTNERTASTPADEATAPDAGDDDTGTVELELSRQWELDAFADAVLSVSTEDGAFYPSVAAVDPDSLDPLWETDIVSGVELPAMVDGGVLFFATREGHVYALDGDTGEIEWRERTVARPSYVSLSRNHVWVSDTEGLVYAFSRSDGSTAFESDAHAEEGAALESVNPISATSDTVFIGGTSRSLYTIS